MGSIVSAECKCGFKKEVMLLGGGFSDFQNKASFPYYCPVCKNLFLGNCLAKKVKCKKCISENVYPYDDKRACKKKGQEVFEWDITDDEKDEEEVTLILTDGKYICPKCNEYQLSFYSMGSYD